MASNSHQFSARSDDAIVIRGVHEVATDSTSSAETKKLEGKLDALVNLVTQQAMNQKSSPVARLYGLCSSADHHTDLCPSVQQSEATEQPEAYPANIYKRPLQPQQQNQPQQHNSLQQQQQQQSQKQQTVEAPPQPSLKELLRQMTMQNM